MKNGMYVKGRIKGYQESPWTGPQSSGVNRQLGLVVREYQDRWGDTQESVITVDIHQDRVDEVRTIAEKNRGKDVLIEVVFAARKGGRDGAWLACFMPKEGEIRLAIPQSVDKAS